VTGELPSRGECAGRHLEYGLPIGIELAGNGLLEHPAASIELPGLGPSMDQPAEAAPLQSDLTRVTIASVLRSIAKAHPKIPATSAGVPTKRSATSE
jgi:hypothetical protein